MNEVKAAIYARYSSDLQRPESIEDQVRQCKEFIQSKDWVLHEHNIFTDYAITGTDTNRPEYTRLRAGAQTGHYQCIVVDDLSRLGRDTAESIRIFREFGSLGVSIVSVSDGIDTSQSASKLPYYFKSIMNEIYLDDLRDKVLRGMKGQVERGYSVGGRVYGYRREEIIDPSGSRDKHGRLKRLGVKIEVDPDQAEIVRYIFNLKLKGLGIKSITKILNEKGVEPPQNPRANHKRSWATSTVWAILSNAKYIGDWTWNKCKWPKKLESSRRKKVALPESEWVVNIREDLRIIDQETWDLIQDQKRKRRPINPVKNGKLTGYQGTGHRAKYLLSGLLECGQCGGSLIVISSGKRSVYVCNNHWSRGDTVCTNKVRIKRSEIEDLVVETISQRLLNPDTISVLQHRVQKIVDAALAKSIGSLPAIERQLRTEKRELGNLVRFVAQGDTSSAVRQLISEKEATIDTLQRQIDGLPHRTAIERFRVTKEQIAQRLGKLKELMTRKQESLKLVQAELRNLIEGKIALSPEDTGDYYKIKGLIKAKLSFLFSQPLSVMVYGGGGNRTPVRV